VVRFSFFPFLNSREGKSNMKRGFSSPDKRDSHEEGFFFGLQVRYSSRFVTYLKLIEETFPFKNRVLLQREIVK
jgi:hypothetical protein